MEYGYHQISIKMYIGTFKMLRQKDTYGKPVSEFIKQFGINTELCIK